MHNHNRFDFFSEGRFAQARQDRSGHNRSGYCRSEHGGRTFGHRPGGPRFGEDGPRGFRGGPRGPRAKVGNMRLAVLALLAESARNGYGLMQEIAQRSGGLWQPSPGAMYPALSQLEDEGLIVSSTQEGKKAYTLTEAGHKFVQDNQEALKAPWQVEQEGDQGGKVELRPLAFSAQPERRCTGCWPRTLSNKALKVARSHLTGV
jgi:DNA-binding PadR family transcriptional regulator